TSLTGLIPTQDSATENSLHGSQLGLPGRSLSGRLTLRGYCQVRDAGRRQDCHSLSVLDHLRGLSLGDGRERFGVGGCYEHATRSVLLGQALARWDGLARLNGRLGGLRVVVSHLGETLDVAVSDGNPIPARRNQGRHQSPSASPAPGIVSSPGNVS